jgi:hypothetical protein
MNYLLSVENLKKLGLIQSNTDTKILAVAIKRSQDIQLQPALSTPLFKALLLRVQNNTWTQNYLDLMNDFVVPCLVAFVDYRCALLLNEKLTNKSVGRVQDENIQPNSDAETSALRDQLRKDAYFYKERLIVHLMADNGTKYPEYIETNSSPGHCSEDMRKDRSGYTPINFII